MLLRILKKLRQFIGVELYNSEKNGHSVSLVSLNLENQAHLHL